MQVYQVGGSVRDELLGLPVKEYDWIVVGATPEQLLAQGYQPVGKDFPVFLHPKTHEEYALARTERKSGRGHTGFICYSSPDVTLEQDLLRRDLTINAIAKDTSGKLIDPYHGIKDLKLKCLRHVSEAFAEDPLRVLRVARFHARFAKLGFTVAPETLNLMRDMTQQGELNSLSAERVWQELLKALHTDSPAQFFITLQACGALAALYPELDQQDIERLQAVSSQTHEPLLRFAALSYPVVSDAGFNSNPYWLKIPKDYRELSELTYHYHPALLQFTHLSAEQKLSLLQSCDAIRRPDRFDLLLQAVATIQQTDLSNWLTALNRIKQIDINPLLTQGLTGEALGAAIRQARLHQLQ